MKVNTSKGLPNTLNQKPACTYFTTGQFAISGSRLAVNTERPLKVSGLFHIHQFTFTKCWCTTQIPPFIATSLFTKPQHTLHVLCANYTLDITASSSTDATHAVWGNTNGVKTSYKNSYAFCVRSEQSDLQSLHQSRAALQTHVFLLLSTAHMEQAARNTNDIITNWSLFFQPTLH